MPPVPVPPKVKFVFVVFFPVEVRSGSEGYVIKMRDGKNLRCVHNNSQGRNIPESAPQPAIVLRIEDGSETLLPIIVCT